MFPSEPSRRRQDLFDARGAVAGVDDVFLALGDVPRDGGEAITKDGRSREGGEVGGRGGKAVAVE